MLQEFPSDSHAVVVVVVVVVVVDVNTARGEAPKDNGRSSILAPIYVTRERGTLHEPASNS